MRNLAEIGTGESAVISHIKGSGPFRARLSEMGFVCGKTVRRLGCSPIGNPIVFELMGSQIALRKSEARKIRVTGADETVHQIPTRQATTEAQDKNTPPDGHASECHRCKHTETPTPRTECDCPSCGPKRKQITTDTPKEEGEITIALVGNPNCGKTSLFNAASGGHERTGNYSGVTVSCIVGRMTFEGRQIRLVDLPGTYSLRAFSPEEAYVAHELESGRIDAVINVLDTTNLERNLLLTLQLKERNVPLVGALNMFDEFESRGDKLDYNVLGELFGIPLVPTVFKSGRGVEELFKTVIDIYEGRPVPGKSGIRHIHLNHGKYIEQAIEDVKKEIQKNEQIRYKYSTRFLSIKLLEKDSKAEELAMSLPNGREIISTRDSAAEYIMKETKEDSETAIMNAKYGIIHGSSCSYI